MTIQLRALGRPAPVRAPGRQPGRQSAASRPPAGRRARLAWRPARRARPNELANVTRAGAPARVARKIQSFRRRRRVGWPALTSNYHSAFGSGRHLRRGPRTQPASRMNIECGRPRRRRDPTTCAHLARGAGLALAPAPSSPAQFASVGLASGKFVLGGAIVRAPAPAPPGGGRKRAPRAPPARPLTRRPASACRANEFN